MEIGKELAVSHAPPFVSVDVQGSIAILYKYIVIIWHNASTTHLSALNLFNTVHYTITMNNANDLAINLISVDKKCKVNSLKGSLNLINRSYHDTHKHVRFLLHLCSLQIPLDHICKFLSV